MSTNDLVAQAKKILSRFSSTPRFDATKCFSSAFIASSHASFIKPFHASRSDWRSFHLICMRNSSTRLDGNKCDSISLFLVPSSHTGSGTLKAPNASSAGILRHTKDPFPRYQLYSRTALCWWINRQMLDWATTTAGRKGGRGFETSQDFFQCAAFNTNSGLRKVEKVVLFDSIINQFMASTFCSCNIFMFDIKKK